MTETTEAIGPKNLAGENDNQGLPELDQAGSGSTEPKKKKPPLLPLMLLVLFVIAVLAGVQLYISKGDFFHKKGTKIVEPPVPVLAADVPEGGPSISIPTDTTLPVSADLSNSDSTETKKSDSEHLSANSAEIALPPELISTIGNISSDVARLNSIVNQQSQLLSKMAQKLEQMNGVLESITVTGNDTKRIVKDNSQWLSGVSNQLKDIGVTVKSTALDFPLVVYSRNVWGNDVYLTVAPTAHPDQTYFLHSGGVVGKWRLTSISETQAIFVHENGQEKVVKV